MTALLELFEEAIGVEAALSIAGQFEALAGQAQARGEAGVMVVRVAAAPGARDERKVVLASSVATRFKAPKAEEYMGRIWVIEGVLTVDDPQPSLFEAAS